VFTAGIYIEEKSIYVPFITGAGAIVNVLANFLLIPILSITGAALATLASYLVMAAGYYLVTQKFYQVNYELKRIGHIFIAITVIGFLYYYLYSTGIFLFLYKVMLFILFALYIYFVAINRDEINLIRKKFAEGRRNKN
jgi:O-antigen/teichoic acid export membrane protein